MGMLTRGLEPPRVSPYGPEPYASAIPPRELMLPPLPAARRFAEAARECNGIFRKAGVVFITVPSMKKSERIHEYVRSLGDAPDAALDPHYTGFFACFNRGEYYEAHDVLEQLWLKTRDGDRAFYQGLIQIAGAFVHLRKQYLRPEHPKDGRRLRPAARLFALGLRNIAPYGPVHLRLDVAALAVLCTRHAETLIASGFPSNPWNPERLPCVELMDIA